MADSRAVGILPPIVHTQEDNNILTVYITQDYSRPSSADVSDWPIEKQWGLTVVQ